MQYESEGFRRTLVGLKRSMTRTPAMRTRQFQTDPRGVEAPGVVESESTERRFQTDPRGVEAV